MTEIFKKHTTVICLTIVSLAAIIADSSGIVVTLWLMYGAYKLITYSD